MFGSVRLWTHAGGSKLEVLEHKEGGNRLFLIFCCGRNVCVCSIIIEVLALFAGGIFLDDLFGD